MRPFPRLEDERTRGQVQREGRVAERPHGRSSPGIAPRFEHPAHNGQRFGPARLGGRCPTRDARPGPRRRPNVQQSERSCSREFQARLGAGLDKSVGEPGRTASHAQGPSALQAVIDHTLEREPLTSPSGLTLVWGSDVTISFRNASHASATFSLTPQSEGREHQATELTKGPFVFGASGVTESPGRPGYTSYSVRTTGIEQLFHLLQRPAGVGAGAVVTLRVGGGLNLSLGSPSQVVISASRGPVMTYGRLHVTDATGTLLPSHFLLARDQLDIVFDDARAVYPVTVDPWAAPSPTPLASYSGTTGAELGVSVALPADSTEAVVGAPLANGGDGATYVYDSSGGAWSMTPAATFTGAPGAGLGVSAAVSADGTVLLLGARGGDGSAFVYDNANGAWSMAPAATLRALGGGFGTSVALSADGTVALIGAPYIGSGNAAYGAAYIYDSSGGTWSLTPAATFTDHFEDFG